MVRRTVFVRTTAVLGLAAGLALASPGVAHAQLAHPRIVQTAPAGFTPHLAGSGVATYAFEQVGSTMYAGGKFQQVQNSGRNTTYSRSNMFAFNATTGTVSSFAPSFNAPVWAIRADGSSLFVGGEFTSVNGTARRGIVKISAATGAVDPTFNANLPSGRVTEIRVVSGRVIIGGTFPKRLAALSPTTGADTGYLNLGISGSVGTQAGPTEVYRFAVDPAGTRLVAVGNMTTVGGQRRYRAFMLTLGATSGTVHPWYYQPLDRPCRANSLVDYLRDVDFSPDGSYFAMVSTGWIPRDGEVGITLCDATARFDTNASWPYNPKWINYTGGDTLHSVAITGAAVYVQGHQRWLDNPYGNDFAGPGAVSRPGIGAIDPTTGRALAWNPTKTRAVGGKELYATADGLWVGSDGKYYNSKYHYGIAFARL